MSQYHSTADPAEILREQDEEHCCRFCARLFRGDRCESAEDALLQNGYGQARVHIPSPESHLCGGYDCDTEKFRAAVGRMPHNSWGWRDPEDFAPPPVRILPPGLRVSC